MKNTLFVFITICFILNCSPLQPRLEEITITPDNSDLHYGETLSLSVETVEINQPVFTWTATSGSFDNAKDQAPRWTAPDETGTVIIGVSVLGETLSAPLTKTIPLEVIGPLEAVMYNFNIETISGSTGSGQIAYTLTPAGYYESGTSITAQATANT